MARNGNIEDLPFLTFNLKILKFLSFLLVHNWRRYVAIVPYGLSIVSQIIDLHYTAVPLETLMVNIYITTLFLNASVRGVLLCYKQFEYQQFMERLKMLYLELENSSDRQIQRMLRECTEAQIKISKMNMTMSSLACLGFIVYPLFVSTRILPFAVYIPGFDEYQSPWYQVIYLILIIMLPIGMFMYIPFSNLVISFFSFAILMCKVLQHKLRTLERSSDKKIFNEIILCIKYQLKLVSFVQTINDLTTNLFLLEYLLFGAMLCLILFILIIVTSVGQVVIVIIYITMTFSQSFGLYYYANELYYQSLEVAVAAYDSQWYDFDMQTQKTIKLLLLRSQKPCAILLGNAYSMNLKRLQSLIRAAYSYYTLLKRVYG